MPTYYAIASLKIDGTAGGVVSESANASDMPSIPLCSCGISLLPKNFHVWMPTDVSLHYCGQLYRFDKFYALMLEAFDDVQKV